MTRSANSGVFYSLAAGNENVDACSTSPARVGAGTNNGIMTTAATDSSDKEASFSNYGSCVDIWAPGVSILSTKRGGGTTTMSGTSMASPHTGGTGALYLSSHTTDSPSAVESALKASATTPARSARTHLRVRFSFSTSAGTRKHQWWCGSTLGAAPL
ncbi:MAG: S8 family serine peptidase [Rubrobacter sp.]|nr:S8 family serine peptidase [Rubrobacter sp.]